MYRSAEECTESCTMHWIICLHQINEAHINQMMVLLTFSISICKENSWAAQPHPCQKPHWLSWKSSSALGLSRWKMALANTLPGMFNDSCCRWYNFLSCTVAQGVDLASPQGLTQSPIWCHRWSSISGQSHPRLDLVSPRKFHPNQESFQASTWRWPTKFSLLKVEQTGVHQKEGCLKQQQEGRWQWRDYRGKQHQHWPGS